MPSKRTNKRKVPSDDEENTPSNKRQKTTVKSTTDNAKQIAEKTEIKPEKKGKSAKQDKEAKQKVKADTKGKEKEPKENTKKGKKDKGKERVDEEEIADSKKPADVGVVLPLAPPVDVIVTGSGEIGQLGLGKDVFEKKKPALLKSLANKRIAKMAVGGLHVAVLIQQEDGDPSKTSLFTWGCNDQSILGRSTETEEDDDLSMSPGLVESLEGKQIVEVSTGEYHMTALDNQGRLFVWGTYKDQEGFLGFTKQHEDIQKIPTLFPGLNKMRVKQVASGHNHTLVLNDKGEIFIWGFSWIGRRASARIKRGNLTPAIVRLQPASHPPKIKAIYAGGYHNFVVTEDDRVLAWGLNNAGQLGLGNKGDGVPTPTEIPSFSGQKIVSITGGQHHSLALLEDGRVYSFGRGAYGQLGHGDLEDALTPKEIKTFTEPGDKVVKIGCGDAHSIAITQKGKLFTWGFGERYQLGTNEEQDELVPRNIPFNGYDIVAGGGGGQHSTFLGRKKEAE